ncbi:MAG: DCC1-like thiol-disulfide oxidoreductase family protein [Gemmatimonadota bacterium]
MATGLIRRLDQYWFGPGSLGHVALFRIFVAGGHLFLFYPNLQRLAERFTAPNSEFMPIPALKVLLLPLGEWGLRPDATLIQAVWVFGILAGIGAVLGKYTRLSLISFATVQSLLTAYDYSFGVGHHPDALSIIMLWALAFSPCGERWSLDDLQWRLRSAGAVGRFAPLGPRDDASAFARWPLLLAQWLLALAYLSAAASKMYFGGLEWFRSSTLAYYLVQDGIWFDQPLGIFLAGYPALLSVAAVVTVLFEGTFFVAVLAPRTAWIYILTGVGLHVGILLTMAAPFLQWLVLYTAFLPTLASTFPGSWIRARIPAPKRWTVVYDGRCPLCIRSMVLLDYLDVRRNLTYLDLEAEWEKVREAAPALTRERALHLMHVVGPDGSLSGGFAAFREMTRVLPLLWPLYPLARAPLADLIGQRVYGLVASRRGRAPCGAEGCRVREAGTPAANGGPADSRPVPSGT